MAEVKYVRHVFDIYACLVNLSVSSWHDLTKAVRAPVFHIGDMRFGKLSTVINLYILLASLLSSASLPAFIL